MFGRRQHLWGLGAVGTAVVAVLALAPCLVHAQAAGKRAPDVRLVDVAGFKRALAEAQGKPGTRAVFVNVWATWCEPCKEEMPDLVRFAQEQKAHGVRVLLVSADPKAERAAVGQYLGSLGVDFRSYLKTGDDMEFINSIDPAWDGTLPASWLFDPSGKRLQLWSGRVTLAELNARVAKLPEPGPADQTSRRKR